MVKKVSANAKSKEEIIQTIDISKLSDPSPANVISEIVVRNKIINRAAIVTAMSHANIEHSNNGTYKRSVDEFEASNLKELQELIKTAQIIEFDVTKYRRDLHVRDISRKVDGCIKGGSLTHDGKLREGSRIKSGLALVYADKPNTGVILMEHEPGSVHDLKSILNGHNGTQPNTSLFKPFLPVPFLSRNIKREGALCQGWGCISLVDGNLKSQKTKVKIALLDATIKTNIIPAKPKPKLWLTDITKRVEMALKGSGKKDGHVVVCTPHTTVGITIIKPRAMDDFKETLHAIAPEKINYKHNKTAGDNNGRSHLMAEFIGNFVVLKFENRKIKLGDYKIWSVDCDVQIPREREIITAILN
jgi:secondary thiamine-phosphate synthase enzyme